MKSELPGQGSLQPNQQQRVWVYLVANNESIIELNRMIFTHQTGWFPIISQKGNQYTMVLYNYNSNTILAEGWKSRTTIELTATYDILNNRLTKTGIGPVIQRIDNEVSKIVNQPLQPSIKFCWKGNPNLEEPFH